MPRQNRRERWKSGVQRDRACPAPVRLFLVATLAPRMTAQGIVSVPRKRLAELAGVSERQVTKYVTTAKKRGWLLVVSPGYRTMTAVYQASFPDAKGGTHVFPLSEAESGNSPGPLSAGTHRFPLSIVESGNHSGSHQVGTYVPTTAQALIDAFVACWDRNDDAWEDAADSGITERREAPSVDDLIRDESSSLKATRHLQAVPA